MDTCGISNESCLCPLVSDQINVSPSSKWELDMLVFLRLCSFPLTGHHPFCVCLDVQRTKWSKRSRRFDLWIYFQITIARIHGLRSETSFARAAAIKDLKRKSLPLVDVYNFLMYGYISNVFNPVVSRRKFVHKPFFKRRDVMICPCVYDDDVQFRTIVQVLWLIQYLTKDTDFPKIDELFVFYSDGSFKTNVTDESDDDLLLVCFRSCGFEDHDETVGLVTFDVFYERLLTDVPRTETPAQWIFCGGPIPDAPIPDAPIVDQWVKFVLSMWKVMLRS